MRYHDIKTNRLLSLLPILLLSGVFSLAQKKRQKEQPVPALQSNIILEGLRVKFTSDKSINKPPTDLVGL